MDAQCNFSPTTVFKKVTNISLSPISKNYVILGEKTDSLQYAQVLLLYIEEITHLCRQICLAPKNFKSAYLL